MLQPWPMANSYRWVEPLSAWFVKQARKLPWRETQDPYSIWISEVMLQQTQVTTVIPYYEKFMKRFPKVEKLASAPLEDVLSHWAGLGYYSRARNLHRASQVISEKFNGKFPKERETLLGVPGIGPYTAGAVLSIAFDSKVPLVDGNVERVFSRLFLIEKPIKQKEVQNFLWSAAETAVQASSSPRIFNQALMELGALVCTKGTPRCEICPIEKYCLARAQGVEAELPVKIKPREKLDLFWLGLVFEQNGKWLLKQNESGAWWHGLWDFPHVSFENAKQLQKEEKDS